MAGTGPSGRLKCCSPDPPPRWLGGRMAAERHTQGSSTASSILDSARSSRGHYSKRQDLQKTWGNTFPQRTPGARSPKSRSQFPATVSDSAIRQILIWGWPIVTPAVTQLDRLRPLLHRPARPHRPAAGPHRPRLTGATRAHPGLDQALAAVRADDTLVVPKLDGLACSDPRRRSPGADARPCLLGPRGPGRRSRGSRCRRSEAVEAGCGTGVRRTPQGGT